jgi:hypothetical protein
LQLANASRGGHRDRERRNGARSAHNPAPKLLTPRFRVSRGTAEASSSHDDARARVVAPNVAFGKSSSGRAIEQLDELLARCPKLGEDPYTRRSFVCRRACSPRGSRRRRRDRTPRSSGRGGTRTASSTTSRSSRRDWRCTPRSKHIARVRRARGGLVLECRHGSATADRADGEPVVADLVARIGALRDGLRRRGGDLPADDVTGDGFRDALRCTTLPDRDVSVGLVIARRDDSRRETSMRARPRTSAESSWQGEGAASERALESRS